MRRNIISNLFLGLVRGIGMAIGFSGIAVILIAVVKIVPLDQIPFIGDIIKALIESRG